MAVIWFPVGVFALISVAMLLNFIERVKENARKKMEAILEQQKLQFEERELFTRYKQEVRESLDKLLAEKTQGFPWLATAIADYYENFDKIFANYLQTKQRPAFVQAEKIREIAKEKKIFKKEFQITKYIIEYYENLFPWLREYVGFDSDELIKSVYSDNHSEEDPVSFYVSTSEFANLSVSERNQKALERYWDGDKSPWQIGKDYERYIGYLYEQKGFKVQYHGIEKAKDDLGRDLICAKGGQIDIVQCKYWSIKKGIPIRENHITQLYGTTIKYFLDRKRDNQKIQLDLFPELLKQNNIAPVLVTTTDLSSTAIEFATVLGIRTEKIPMDNAYPCIKCNINFQTGERIYHLPFDQQYDTTMIDTSRGEKWVKTVKEAEEHDFRRAWRWRPE